MNFSNDSKAIIALCSHVGLSTNSELKPLKLKEWNDLAKILNSISLRPGDLFEFTTNSADTILDLTPEISTRIIKLLQRSGSIAIELERLSSNGINVITRADADYPPRYKQKLKEKRPPVLFFAGEKALLDQPGIAVVGSRNLNEEGEKCAELIGNSCGISGHILFSGGARGVDTISTMAALRERGTAVGILANNLEKAIRDPELRKAIAQGNLCLITPYSPNAPFSVGNAMGRNKLIYSIADYAIVVASDNEKGGTWSGAIEAIKHRWTPVFIADYESSDGIKPEGNEALINYGGIPFPSPFPIPGKLVDWLKTKSANFYQDNPSKKVSEYIQKTLI